MRTFRLPSISLTPALLIAGGVMLAVVLSVIATPQLVEAGNAPKFEDTIPREFGVWRELPNRFTQVSLATGAEAELNQPYDQVLMRTYVNDKGDQVMLALAWGMQQRQEKKIHRPDLCYVAQGYRVSQIAPATFSGLDGSGREVLGKHMLAASGREVEAVAYWIRIGSLYSENAFETRIHILKEGLAGRIPDGILVRASQRLAGSESTEDSFSLMHQFLSDLVAATPASARELLVRG